MAATARRRFQAATAPSPALGRAERGLHDRCSTASVRAPRCTAAMMDSCDKGSIE